MRYIKDNIFLFCFSTLIFVSSCSGKGDDIIIDDPSPPDIPTIKDCPYVGLYEEEEANIKIIWNSSSKACINSCGGAYTIYYLKREDEADDEFLKYSLSIPSNANIFNIPYSSDTDSIPNQTSLKLEPGKWYFKISTSCNNNESRPSNAFVLIVE